MGNNASAIATTAILADIDSIMCMIMIGIAGGIPGAINSERDIRLGELIFPGDPIIQYDFKSMLMGYEGEPGIDSNRRPPCRHCRAIANRLRKGKSTAYWNGLMAEVMERNSNYSRPDATTDPKYKIRKRNPTKYVKNRKNFPRIFNGNIGSANILLKGKTVRNKIREKHSILAVDLESADVADAVSFATEQNGMLRKQYFVVRGISDYLDETKMKPSKWRDYAALAAACFAVAIIAHHKV